MVFKAQKSCGPIVGLLAGICGFAFVFWGIDYSLGPEDMALKMALLLPSILFAVAFCFLLFGAFNIKYIVQDDGLLMVWGIMNKKVPWKEFKELFAVRGEANLFPFLSISWPGYIAGLYTMKGFGPVRIFGTRWEEGFVYLKTGMGFFGVTPGNEEFIQAIASKTGLPVEEIFMDEVPKSVKGTSLKQDNIFSLYYKLNYIALAIFALYVAVFFPGSGAPSLVILLLVIAIALFFFSISNASRLVQFSPVGGYITLLIGLAVTGSFLILSFATIHLNM